MSLPQVVSTVYMRFFYLPCLDLFDRTVGVSCFGCCAYGQLRDHRTATAAIASDLRLPARPKMCRSHACSRAHRSHTIGFCPLVARCDRMRMLWRVKSCGSRDATYCSFVHGLRWTLYTWVRAWFTGMMRQHGEGFGDENGGRQVRGDRIADMVFSVLLI